MKFAAVFAFLFLQSICHAQQFNFKTYTTKEGLSSNAIVCTEPDKKGFLWIATSNGLNRFDGHAFDHFVNNPADSTSLPANEVQTIFTDNKKQLWVGTIAGISKYNQQQQNFTNYFPDSSAGKCGRSFAAMAQDNTGNIWVGTWYELLVFNKQQKIFSRSGWADFAQQHKPANGNNSRIVIVSLLKKSANELWVLTTYGLYSVHTGNRQFTYYPNNSIDDYFGCQIKYMDEDGLLWMGSYSKGIFCFDSKKNQWQNFTMPASWQSPENFFWAYNIISFKQDTLMYCGLNGIGFFNKKSRRFINQFTHDKENDKSYPVAASSAITVFNNAYWLSSASGLIKMYKPQTSIEQTIPFAKNDWLGYVFPLAKNSQLLIGNNSQQNMAVLDEATGNKAYLKNKNGAVLSAYLTGYFQLDNENAIISAEEKLYSVNMENLLADSILLPAKRFPQNGWVFRNTVKDNDGKLYIRSRQQGILQYQPANGQWQYTDFIKPSFEKTYAAMYFDAASNSLWVSVENEGVYMYHIPSKQTKHYLLQANNAGNAATIISIKGSRDGNIYLADAHKGFYQFNPKNNHFKLFTTQDGLPSNICYNITEDNNGIIWITGSEGISKFNSANNTFTFLETDGLFAKSNPAIIAGNGALYTVEGGTLFSWPATYKADTMVTSTIYIRSVLVNNIPFATDSVYRLAYWQNNIMLQIGALNFTAKNQPVLLYAIINKTAFTKLPIDGKINFINLSSGTYLLQVKEYGTNNFLTIQIVIASPFWTTWWFIALFILLAATVIFFFINRRITAFRKATQLKQRVAETEMMALRAQMNPHFIFNCISSIDNFILGNDKENASAYLNTFAKLIRNILDNSKNEVVPFWKDWETIQLYLGLEKLRGNNTFDFQLHASEALLNGHYKIPPLIIQPYIENAIHHGLMQRKDGGGKLVIIADLQGDLLKYTIHDNGIGREKAAQLKQINTIQHTSYGMQLSEERIALFNNSLHNNIKITDLKDDDGNATGTLVEVSLNI